MIITNLAVNMVLVSMTGLYPFSYSSNQTFRDFSCAAAFHQATNLITVWHIDLPQPSTTNMVTGFISRPCVEGANITITFSNRFVFSWSHGYFDFFEDRANVVQSMLTPCIETNKLVYDAWMRAKNQLNLKQAQQIAESAMKSAGVSMDKSEFKKPTKAEQDGGMPYYLFEWNQNHAYCTIDVSGITSNLVHFDLARSTLKPIKPSNELLGLPANPIFVWRLPAPPGMPPSYELYTNFSSLDLK